MTTRLPKRNVIINTLLFITFTAFAILQLNDPDPEIWFLIYLSIAIICLLVNFIYINHKITFSFITFLILYAAFHFNYLLDWLHTNDKEEIFGKMVYEKPYLEGSREFIGLAMGICGLLIASKKNKKTTT